MSSTNPVPFVVRSTVVSCITTSWPSRVASDVDLEHVGSGAQRLAERVQRVGRELVLAALVREVDDALGEPRLVAGAGGAPIRTTAAAASRTRNTAAEPSPASVARTPAERPGMRLAASLLLFCTIAVLVASPAAGSVPVSRATGGGSFVGIPGWPKATIDSRLLGDVGYLVRKYHLRVTTPATS